MSCLSQKNWTRATGEIVAGGPLSSGRHGRQTGIEAGRESKSDDNQGRFLSA